MDKYCNAHDVVFFKSSALQPLLPTALIKTAAVTEHDEQKNAISNMETNLPIARKSFKTMNRS